MKNFILLITMVVMSLSAFSQSKNPNDTLQIGQGSSASDKGLIFNTADGVLNKTLKIEKTSKKLKFSGNDFQIGDTVTGNAKKIIIDSTSGAYLGWDGSAPVFSDDGVIVKKLGSGSGSGGGGQNFFTSNSDADSGTNNWVNTGTGTFVTFASSPINGLNSFRWDASAQNDVIRTEQILIPNKFKGQACEINFSYTGGTSDLVKPQVVDSSNVKLPGATYINQVDGTDFLQAQTIIVQRSIYFLCPTTGTIAFEFNQTEVGNPAALDFDDVHVGELIGLQTTVLAGTWIASPDIITENLGTITNKEEFSRKREKDLIIRGYFDVGTAVAATASLSLPAGYTIDNSRLPNVIADIARLGQGEAHTGGSFSSGNKIIIFADGTTTDKVFFAIQSGGNEYLKGTGNGLFVSNNGFTYEYSVPVIENAATPVKIYNSVPKVAENVNDFSATIDATSGTPILISESAPFIASIDDLGVGSYRINYIPGTFSVLPSINASQALSGVTQVTIPLTTSVEMITRSGVGGGGDTVSYVRVSKQGVDFKMPVVQPVIFQAGLFSPGVNRPRTKVFKLYVGGVATNGGCNASPCSVVDEHGIDWINGNVTRATTGQYRFVTNAVFKPNEIVDCSCNTVLSSPTSGNCYKIGTSTVNFFQANGSGILDYTGSVAPQNGYFSVVNTAGSAGDAPFWLTCESEE